MGRDVVERLVEILRVTLPDTLPVLDELILLLEEEDTDELLDCF